MNDEKKIDKLLRTIRALRAKAEGTNNEAEASAFAAKAAAMMAEYGLEEAQLRVEEQSGIEHEREKQNWSSPARRLVAIMVCRLYMVRPIMPGRQGMPWTLIGRRHNIVMAKEMTDYLIKTTLRLSTQWRKENFATGAEMIDFRRGCFERLSERLNDLRLAQQTTAPVYNAGGNPGNLPALYENENRLLKAYEKERFQTRPSRPIGLRVGQAGQAGRRAGEGVSLSPQIGGKGSGAMLIGGRR